MGIGKLLCLMSVTVLIFIVHFLTKIENAFIRVSAKIILNRYSVKEVLRCTKTKRRTNKEETRKWDRVKT